MFELKLHVWVKPHHSKQWNYEIQGTFWMRISLPEVFVPEIKNAGRFHSVFSAFIYSWFVDLHEFSKASQVAQWSRINLPMQETWVQSLGGEDPLEGEMATHSSIHAWEIPWTEEPGGLQSMGSQRVRHSWSDSACTHGNNKQILCCDCRGLGKGVRCLFGADTG